MKRGFTLVELAIVVIVIGLIVGGVLQGQALIEQARIRKVINQMHEYDTAIGAFRAKYNGIPGDLINAAFFGLNLSPSTGSVNVSYTGYPTSFAPPEEEDGEPVPILDNNGNGDGVLGTENDNPYVWFQGEVMNFWIHLSNAKLIKESFSQSDGCNHNGDTVCNADVGVAYPEAAIGTGILAVTDTVRRNSLYYILGANSIMVWLINGEGATDGPVGDNLTTEQAWSIDTKLDDSKPDTGEVVVIRRYQDAALVIDDSLDAEDCYENAGGDYNFNIETKVCTLGIRANY